MKWIFILPFCLLFSNNTYTQTGSSSKDLSLFPIRVEHKWGYAKFYDTYVDTLVPPKYDYISDIFLPWNYAGEASELSPFRLFEIDNKVGLLDTYLNELVASQYNRIRPISPTFFAVETDRGFQLIDREGTLLFDGKKYDDIKGDRHDKGLRFFFVKKARQWAVLNREGRFLVDFRYAAIEGAGCPGFFKVKSSLDDPGWALVDSTGQNVLPGRYADVRVVDKKVIAVRKEGRIPWQYFRWPGNSMSDRYVLEPDDYSSVKKVAEGLLVLVPYHPLAPEQVQLLSLRDFRILKELEVQTVGGGNSLKMVPDYFPLDESYALRSVLSRDRRAIQYQLIDQKGDVRSVPCDTILTTGKKQIYFAAFDSERNGFTERRWGVLNAGNDRVAKFNAEYEEIFDFEDDIAITRLGDSYGALAVKAQQTDTLPCIFETAFKSGKTTLQVQTKNEKAVIYELSPAGKFVEDVIVDNTIVFSGNVHRRYKEAEYAAMKPLPPGEPGPEERQWQHLTFSYDEGRLALQTNDSVFLKTEIREEIIALEEVSPGIVAIYYQNDPVENETSRAFSRYPLARIAFFDTRQNRLITDFHMVGFRSFDKDYEYTSFMDKEGRMGLVDRNGRQLVVDGKPLRFLYIGPFHAGRARVCSGDRYVPDKDYDLPQPSVYSLGMTDEFMTEFHIKRTGKNYSGKEFFCPLYASGLDAPCRWGFIDEKGNVAIDTMFDFAEDFHRITRRALVYRTVENPHALKPSAECGAVDSLGNKVLDVVYKDIGVFEQFFIVSVGETPTFYFNKKGRQVFVNPTRMRPFSEGLALFRSPENKWGFVDTSGRILIEPRFEFARPFSDGLALVAEDTGFCKFIDRTGSAVFTTTFTKDQWPGLGDFREGRSWFKGDKAWFWGCFDRKGDVIFEPQYFHELNMSSRIQPDEAYALPMDFVGGVASVQVLSAAGKPVYTVIDTTGTRLVEPGKFAHISPFNTDGLAVYSLSSTTGKGLINKKGEVLTAAVYSSIGSFENGYAKVQSNAGEWGLVNTRGEQVLPAVYTHIGPVSEGLIPVKRPGSLGWFFVNLSGQEVIPGPFKEVTPFQRGMSFVREKEQQKLIDKTGRQLSFSTGEPLFFSEGILGMLKNEPASPQQERYFYADETGNNILGQEFAEITPFQLGVAKVRRLSATTPGATQRLEPLGAINKRGVMVVPPKFRNLHLQPDGNIIINPQRFYGMASFSGEILLEPVYDRILYCPKENIYRVEQGEKIGYVEWKGEEVGWIWALQY